MAFSSKPVQSLCIPAFFAIFVQLDKCSDIWQNEGQGQGQLLYMLYSFLCIRKASFCVFETFQLKHSWQTDWKTNKPPNQLIRIEMRGQRGEYPLLTHEKHPQNATIIPQISFLIKIQSQQKKNFCTKNFSVQEHFVIIFFLFGQRPQRGPWPMLSHRRIFSSFFSFSFSVPPPLKAQILDLRFKP